MIAPQTSFIKPADRLHDGSCPPQWFVLDATDMVVGRLASQLATVLMGKHKPEYTPHCDTGDYVIVINADKVRFTGSPLKHRSCTQYTTKMSKKGYRWYTGYPSGQKEIKAVDLWEKKPTEILKLAVKRMMPKNALARHMLDKLKLFAGTTHEHQAQQPVPFPEYLLPK